MDEPAEVIAGTGVRRAPRLRARVLGIACLATALPAAAQGVREVSPFRPCLSAVEFTPATVRPGDEFAYTLRFENAGSAPARDDYTVFLHFETRAGRCREIVMQQDHEPPLRTRRWEAGQCIVDGPRILRPKGDVAEGEYLVHVGLFDRTGARKRRVLDVLAGTLVLSRSASPSAEWRPEALPEAERALRDAALARRLARPVVLEQRAWSFALDTTSAAFLLTDRQSGVVWGSNVRSSTWGPITLASGEREVDVSIERFDHVALEGDRLVAGAALAVDGEPSGLEIRLLAEPCGIQGLRLRYETCGEGPWRVKRVRILDHAFATTDADGGYTLVPSLLGQILPADRGLPNDRRYLTYRETSLAMAGQVRQGSALLLAWPHPDTLLETHATCEDSPIVPGRRTNSVSISLEGDSREIEVHPLGRGGYVEIARAYREVAERYGWRVTLAEKARASRSAELAGAASFKPCVLFRALPRTGFNPAGDELVHLRHSFDEVARCAEHWRRDLGIDRALVVLTGWNHRGYDNQHPDVLPACPEAGGNAGLADCARRIQDCGFLFGLHDNYQDIYRDAPSWDPALLVVGPDGEAQPGGQWSGGQAWQVCSVEQVALARRNLPELRELFAPDLGFLDTTLSWHLVTCHSPRHPMRRADDLAYKSRLLSLTAETFGMCGTEGGREWGVPGAHFMEGLLSHKTHRIPGWIVVPVFPIVYGDCVRLFTRQDEGERLRVGEAESVLDHLLYGEVPLYRFGDHAYFENSAPSAAPLRPEECFARGDDGWAAELGRQDRFIKNTYEVLSWTSRLREGQAMDDHAFLAPDRSVERSRFGDLEVTVNYGPQPFAVEDLVLPQYGFHVRGPGFLAFHASRRGGIEYGEGALFTLRSLDGLPLERSSRVRVFHGFGPSLVQIGSAVFTVPREAIVGSP
jgi:hypothetical protein